MDEFLDWLLECYASGDLTDDDIELALVNDRLAYEIFLECWTMDKTDTGQMAQQVFKKAKNLISIKAKHGKPNP